MNELQVTSLVINVTRDDQSTKNPSYSTTKPPLMVVQHFFGIYLLTCWLLQSLFSAFHNLAAVVQVAAEGLLAAHVDSREPLVLPGSQSCRYQPGVEEVPLFLKLGGSCPSPYA